jgi:hypothetical protein
MEIGYAYATSPIANHFGYDNGCAFLRAPDKDGGIVHTFDDKHEKALENAMRYAHMNGIELTKVSREWAETIINIRRMRR